MYKLQNHDKGEQFEVYFEDSKLKMTWEQANDYCKDLGPNWRLPTIDELKIIYSDLYKAEKGDFKPSFYWSSDIPGVNYRAYFMNFWDGTSNNGNKTGPAYAIAVRPL